MKATPLFAVTLAVLALTACKSRDPQTLSGRDRQPINVGAVIGAPTAAVPTHEGIAPFANAPTGAQEAPQAASDALPATTLHEIKDGAEMPALTVLERAYSVRFPYGSAKFVMPDYASAEMLQNAPRAAVIVVRGRTDGAKWSAGDERVALQRAIAARDYLVAHGIAADKIQISYLSGGDYVADNTTSEGRSQNRRVELQLIMPPQPIG